MKPPKPIPAAHKPPAPPSPALPPTRSTRYPPAVMGTRIKSILPSQGRRNGSRRRFRLHALPGTRHEHSHPFSISAFQHFSIYHHDLLPFDWDSALKTAEIRFQLEKNGTKIGPYDLQLCGQALALDLRSSPTTSTTGMFPAAPSSCFSSTRKTNRTTSLPPN